MSSTSSLLQRTCAEIIGLHAFFERWLRASETCELDFERCEMALAANFQMVQPNGCLLERDAVVSTLKALRGSAKPGFTIAIEDIFALWENANAIFVTYVEAQNRGGTSTRRRASAFFLTEDSAPHGVAWRHLHETWMHVTECEQVQPTIAKKG